ncbi:MAG: glutathione peroxidase [Gammaproteobacteria bacterium]|nr:glutathione peroxidase [Gammaproteobacteria bacterium]
MAVLMFSLSSFSALADEVNCPVNLDFTKRYLASDESVRLCDAYADKVLLIVNTASYCGFTSQFEGLEALQQKYAERGFSVLGFPSNDFFQDPRSEEKIREFCDLTYEVKFPMFEKSKVAKRHAEPLYQALGEEAGHFPKWNFHKYLIDKNGHVVGSFGPTVAPNNGELIEKIESLL